MAILTAAAVLVAVATLIYAYYSHKFSFFSSRGIRGPKPVIFQGNMSLEKPWMVVARRREQEYGKVYGVYDGTKPKLVINDPVILKRIMVRDFAHFTDRITDRFEHPIEQKMMHVLKGDEWSAWRKIMTPAFSPQKLKAMMPMIQSSTDNLVTELRKRAGESVDIRSVDIRSVDIRSVDIRSVDIRSIVTSFSLEVIAKTGLGIEMNLYERPEPVAEAIKLYFRTSSWKLLVGNILPTWFKSLIRYTAFNKEGLEAACKYMAAVIQERRKDLDQKRDFSDFTSILLKAARDTTRDTSDGHQLITDEAIIASVFIIFIAGFEATALLLSLTIYHLAQSSEIQDRVYDEVMSVCHGDKNSIDFTSVKELKYMEAVLNEILRIYPPATFIERQVSKDYDLDGISLPAGLRVLLPIYLLHHDEKYHRNPERFDPERFMPERMAEIDPFTFLPFGHGPRNCPGIRYSMVSTKVALSRLLMEFEFVRSGDGPEILDVSETVDEQVMPEEFAVGVKERSSKTE